MDGRAQRKRERSITFGHFVSLKPGLGSGKHAGHLLRMRIVFSPLPRDQLSNDAAFSPDAFKFHSSSDNIFFWDFGLLYTRSCHAAGRLNNFEERFSDVLGQITRLPSADTHQDSGRPSLHLSVFCTLLSRALERHFAQILLDSDSLFWAKFVSIGDIVLIKSASILQRPSVGCAARAKLHRGSLLLLVASFSEEKQLSVCSSSLKCHLAIPVRFLQMAPGHHSPHSAQCYPRSALVSGVLVFFRVLNSGCSEIGVYSETGLRVHEVNKSDFAFLRHLVGLFVQLSFCFNSAFLFKTCVHNYFPLPASSYHEGLVSEPQCPSYGHAVSCSLYHGCCCL